MTIWFTFCVILYRRAMGARRPVTYSDANRQAKVFINGNLNKQGPGSGRLSEDWDSYAAFGKHEGTVMDVDTLDEIYMYNRELSPFEIKTLYDNCNFGSAKTRK